MWNKRTVVIGFAAGVAMSVLPFEATAAGKNELEQIYSRAWKNAKTVKYVEPSTQDMKSMEKLFVRLFKGESNSALKKEIEAHGWTVSTATLGGAKWTIVAEDGGQREGRGLYAFSNKGRHALQAPHVPTDKLTGEILLHYAEDGLPRALAWNTVSRKKADLADLNRSYLMAFSRAFVQTHPQEKLVQLHGFDWGKRRTVSAAMSSAIVSPAHRNPSSALKTGVGCMQQKIDKGVRLYGLDVRELGGTTNSVARALRSDGYEGFVHVELDTSLRKRLTEDAGRRKSLLDCLGGEQ